MSARPNQMERDWDARARENALRWIAEVEDEGEFDRSGEQHSRMILEQLTGLITPAMYGLRIGCGVGRIRKHMAPRLREVHVFAPGSLDLVYSYIAFQHLPRKFVYGYFEEVARVPKPAGLFWFQMFRPHTVSQLIKYAILRRDKPDSDTSGIRRYSRGELARMARLFRFEVLSIEKRGLHWLCTFEKPPRC